VKISSKSVQFISHFTYKPENDNVHEEDLCEVDYDEIFEENEGGD
jgi:hypothetical protein